MKHKLRPGFTKASVMEQIKKYNNGTKSTDGISCSYLTPDGNRCAIGAFIPTNHPALLSIALTVNNLLEEFPDLRPLMPFDTHLALYYFQGSHDCCSENSVYDSVNSFLENQCEEA